jgi:hypothetical protein
MLPIILVTRLASNISISGGNLPFPDCT